MLLKNIMKLVYTGKYTCIKYLRKHHGKEFKQFWLAALNGNYKDNVYFNCLTSPSKAFKLNWQTLHLYYYKVFDGDFHIHIATIRVYMHILTSNEKSWNLKSHLYPRYIQPSIAFHIRS